MGNFPVFCENPAACSVFEKPKRLACVVREFVTSSDTIERVGQARHHVVSAANLSIEHRCFAKDIARSGIDRSELNAGGPKINRPRKLGLARAYCPDASRLAQRANQIGFALRPSTACADELDKTDASLLEACLRSGSNGLRRWAERYRRGFGRGIFRKFRDRRTEH
jgi:hypothetical protein